MQATRELRSTGIMQHKRVSNRVGRPCSIRNRVLRVVCAGSTSAPPRAAMKSADRNLKRATRAFGFVWSCYRYIWARSKSASRARPVAVLMRRSGAIYADRALSKLYT